MAAMRVLAAVLFAAILVWPAVCQDHFFIFDIRGDIGVADVLKAVADFQVEYAFQVTGAQRYIVVMPVVQQSQMINLTFAPAAVTSYVAERSDELYARYGAEKNNEQIGDLQGDDLMLVELDYAMNNLKEADYAALMKRLGDRLQSYHIEFPVHGFHVLGHLPVKVLVFGIIAFRVTDSVIAMTGSPHFVHSVSAPIRRLK